MAPRTPPSAAGSIPRLAAAALAIGLGLAHPLARSTTTSHAMTVAGVAQNASGGYSCATSSGDPIIANAFTSGMGLPTEGYAYCNLSGSLVDHAGAGATSATSSASRAFNNGQANLAAAAVANYDHIGTQASASFTGYTSGLSYHSSEGAAIVDDTLTFTGASGTAYVTFGFTVDGSLHANAGSESQTYLAFTAPGNSPQFAFVAKTDGSSSSVGAPYTAGLTGFTSNATDVSGSAVVYTYGIGFTFGKAWDFEYGLRSYAYAAPYTGDAESSFLATARLTSIVVKDSLGHTLDFSATSSSGTLYDAQGAHVLAVTAVPEPASWAMFAGGLGAVALARRRRRA